MTRADRLIAATREELRRNFLVIEDGRPEDVRLEHLDRLADYHRRCKEAERREEQEILFGKPGNWPRGLLS